jgi:NAD(P)-dependent dehydrogenase (short-subunit alcohol dehydrogenase family)
VAGDLGVGSRPAFELPVMLSPSTVTSNVRFNRMGLVIDYDQITRFHPVRGRPCTRSTLYEVDVFGRRRSPVNNVGSVHPRLDGFLPITDDDWMSTLTLNFLAAVRTTRAALPHLLGSAAGTIVTISSVNAFLPDPLVIDYSAAKAALANFCKSLSKEVGPHGVRVNTISPGPVATALWLGDEGVAATVARASGGHPDSVAEQAAQNSVTGRFTRPQEVADLVQFLASDRVGNITGADFSIDGGLITTL